MRKALAAVAVVCAAVLLMRWFPAAGPEQRGYQLFPDMVHSVAFKSQSANRWLSDQKTDQSPAQGTVARGRLPLLFGASEEESLRAGRELSSPLSETDLDLQRGRAIYEIHCQVCHGAGGQGDGPVTRRGVPAPLPFSSEAARSMRDGQIFHIITNGFKNMPAYGGQIERLDRWRAVHYVRSLEGSPQ